MYYYVYNPGLIKARTLTFREKPPGLHKKLWDWCQKQANGTIKQMGVHGLRMHSVRIDADYNDAVIRHLASEVQRQLSRALAFEGLVAQSNGQAPPPPLPP